MIMQLKNIVKSFAGKTILHDIQIEVKKRDRIALVGRNGAGKSTLLKIMTGEMSYDEGEIYHAKQLAIGYLAQHHNLSSENTIWEEMLTVFASLITEEAELLQMAEKISAQSEQGTLNEKLINEYSKRTEEFEENGGYRYKSDMKGILIGLGFPESDFDLPIQKLSGGQKTRLALGKLLLENPGLLILDEPTNHLDIATLTWLENYLTNYNGAIVIVSHDRYFLDKVVTKVYEVAHQRTFLYHGTYTDFLKQKQENLARDLKMYEKQQQEIKEMEDFIQRNIARASTTKRAQSRRKQLDKLDKLERPLSDSAKAAFSFDIAKTSGKDVLQTEDFSFTHPGADEPLFRHVTFAIRRGERIALIGENGIGKTTLLRAIMQEKDAFTHGANVQIGYYAQEQENLDPANTVLEELWGTYPEKSEQEIRTVLGNFLFSGEEVLKNIHMLSGGEKARVSLAKLMLEEANFLILDEPTNHLDLEGKEVLEEALQNYPGTILFVSHDRYFINKIADHVYELDSNGITIYLGNYDYFIEKKEENLAIKQLEKNNADNTPIEDSAPLSFEEQKKRQREARKKEREMLRLEQEIESLELEISDLEQKMTEPEVLHNHEQLLVLSEEVEARRSKLEDLFEQWTEQQE